MPGEPVPDGAAGLRAANARLRSVVEAKDAEIAGLRAEAEAGAYLSRRARPRPALCLVRWSDEWLGAA